MRDHWHGMSRTGVNPAAFAHQPEPLLEMHPQDMAARFLKDGDMVSLRNARGQQIWRIRANPALRSGMLWLPMHWGEEYVWGCSGDIRNLGANTLASPALDPQSLQPELKFASVQLQKQEFPFFLHVVSRLPAERIADVQRACRHLLRDLPYAECLPFGATSTGISLFACLHQPQPAIFEELVSLFGLNQQSCLRYQDGQRYSRRIDIQNRQLQTLMQTGKQALPDWLVQWLKDAKTIDVPAFSLLRDQPPAGPASPRSKQVCQCLGVSSDQIDTFLRQQRPPQKAEDQQQLLQQLQQNLQCGTRCGSCVPELKQKIRELRQAELSLP